MIIFLKFYSIFHEVKEMLQVFLYQYFVVSYKKTSTLNSKNSNNKASFFDYFLFVVYSILKIIFITGIVCLKILKSLLIVKDKGLLGFGLSVVKIGLFLIPVYIISLYLYLSGAVDSAKLKYYQDLHRYRTATAISDNHGNLIGVIKNPTAFPSELLVNKNQVDTLYVNSVPDVLWNLLKDQNNKGLDFYYQNTRLMDVLSFRKRSYKGINIIGHLFSVDFLDEKVPKNAVLMENIVNNLYGDKYFEKSCSINLFKSSKLNVVKYLNKKIISICKQSEYIRAGRHLFPYLARLNGLEFKRWTAMHTPQLTLSHTVSGLRAASEIIFGKALGKLTKVQQALLATAYLHNLQIPSQEFNENEYSFPQTNEVQKQQLLIKYAIAGVKRTYGKKNINEANEIIDGLRRIEFPLRSKYPSEFSKYISSLSVVNQQNYRDLKKRGELLIDGFDNLLKDHLKQLSTSTKDRADKVITDIIVTLPVIDNISFISNVNLVINKKVNEISGKTPFDNGILMRIIVSDEQGKIIRYYNNGHILKRPIMDISKLPASILLASLGDTSKTKYCKQSNDKRASLKNTLKGCSSLKKNTLTFKDSFALSQDVPFFYALSKKHLLSKDDFLALFQDFSIEKPVIYENKNTSSAQLAYDLSFGKVESTPQAVHKFTHKITQTLFNSEFETDPFAIEQFQQADINRSIESYFSGALSSNNTVHKYLKLSSTKSELRKILRASVYDQVGALRVFQNISGARFLFAKSGSGLITKSLAAKEEWSVGAFKLNSRIYTFLIFIGTDSNKESKLGKYMRPKSVIYPIMSEIVKSISARPQNN